MAFSSGFFNARGLDRTYTAEDFCNYLGSLICNGILDSYGDCFNASVNGMTITLGTGKAWINGHYFISDSEYVIDMNPYQDEGNPRYVSIGIVLDTSETVRDVKLEIIPGVPAGNPSVPEIPADGERTVLHLYAVRVSPGVESITEDDILDYRDDAAKCGYCKCILGKCGVTVLMDKIADLEEVIQDNNNKIEELNNKVDELTEDVIETGSCGDNIEYTLFADGRLFLRGSGDMPDYHGPTEADPNNSPFYGNQNIKKLVISSGITSIGDYAFRSCAELESAVFPNTLERIGKMSFFPNSKETVPPTDMHGLKSLRIPYSVSEIEYCAFSGTRLTEVTIPVTVTTLGERIFSSCPGLTTARVEAPVISSYLFVSCPILRSVTLARTVTKICSHWINYCDALTELTYEGSLSDWAVVEKQYNWDGNLGQHSGSLRKVICTDGYMQYDAESHEWTEVRT